MSVAESETNPRATCSALRRAMLLLLLPALASVGTYACIVSLGWRSWEAVRHDELALPGEKRSRVMVKE
jgi:hypothetical protein